MFKNKIGERIQDDKDKIIERYKTEIYISKIADEYGVALGTIYRYLKQWGVTLKTSPRQKHQKKTVKKDHRYFSPELKARMALNSQANNKRVENIQYFKSYDNRFVKRG